MKTAIRRAFSWGLVIGLCGLASARSAEPELSRFESTQPQMGVPFKIILYAPDQGAANAAFEAAFSRIAALNRVLSDYDPDSELSRLSRTSPSEQAVPVSEPLWAVLTRAQTLSVQSGGAFDVTVGPYVRLWRRARRSKEMPSAERLAAARQSVGYEHLELNEQHRAVRLTAPGMHLDLGGIGIGYAVDEVLALLRARGIERALVDGSGDIGVSGPPPGKSGWVIGVVPLEAAGAPSRQIRIANAAVTTSGDAFQHVDIGGRRYSHIVDPHTGLGLTDSSGVTVIAPDCTAADSLTKVVSVLGPAAGMALIEKTPGAAAFIVRATDDKVETFVSSRFVNFVTSDSADSPAK